MKKHFLTAVMLAAIAVTTAACNTVKGLGRDIESVSNAGDKAINH